MVTTKRKKLDYKTHIHLSNLYPNEDLYPNEEAHKIRLKKIKDMPDFTGKDILMKLMPENQNGN